MKSVMKPGLIQSINAQFLLEIVVVACIIEGVALRKVWEQLPITALLPSNYHTEIIIDALSTESVLSYVPIISTLPFSAVYVDDLTSKFVRFYLARSDYQSYLVSRIIMCFLCGGSVILLGGLLSWGFSTLLFLPLEKEAVAIARTQLSQILGLLFLSGGLWAVMGMTMSTVMESKYIAYASPFVIYYLLVILCERYSLGTYLLYPPNWTIPDIWPYGVWGATIFLLELTVVFGIFFMIRAGRRLREL